MDIPIPIATASTSLQSNPVPKSKKIQSTPLQPSRVDRKCPNRTREPVADLGSGIQRPTGPFSRRVPTRTVRVCRQAQASRDILQSVVLERRELTLPFWPRTVRQRLIYPSQGSRFGLALHELVVQQWRDESGAISTTTSETTPLSTSPDKFGSHVLHVEQWSSASNFGREVVSEYQLARIIDATQTEELPYIFSTEKNEADCQ